MAYYSTQARIAALISNPRLNLLGDKDRDGSVDSSLITQALESAKGDIDPYILKAGIAQATIDTWGDTADVPVIVKNINDDLTVYYLAKGATAMNPNVRDNYDIAVSKLEKIAAQDILIPGAIPSSTTYASISVSTDGENRVFTRELLGTPPAASRPSVFESVDDDDDDPETTE